MHAPRGSGPWIVLLPFLLCAAQEAYGQAGAARSLTAYFGDYAITLTGQLALPDGGTVPFTQPATLTLSASAPGVMAVAGGGIQGATVVENPIDVFIGTPTFARPGDTGVRTSLDVSVPSGRGTVNLIYFSVQTPQPTDGTLTIQGRLMDTHSAESTAANMFIVPINHPFLGELDDVFLFHRGAEFELNVASGTVSGHLRGRGASAATLVAEDAAYQATLQGTKTR